MAQRLRAGVEAGLADGSIRGVAFTQPTQANGVFATLPDGVADRLRESFRFYDWDAAKNEVRWMCSFDTTEDDIDAFIAAIARETAARRRDPPPRPTGTAAESPRSAARRTASRAASSCRRCSCARARISSADRLGARARSLLGVLGVDVLRAAARARLAPRPQHLGVGCRRVERRRRGG